MSQKITITLNDAEVATLQQYVNESNRHTNWQTLDNAAAEIICHWLYEKRKNDTFMAQLEKDVEEIHARKAKK